MTEILQDKFLNNLRKEKISVAIFLVNGIKLEGIVEAFDPYTILLKNKLRKKKLFCAAKKKLTKFV